MASPPKCQVNTEITSQCVFYNDAKKLTVAFVISLSLFSRLYVLSYSAIEMTCRAPRTNICGAGSTLSEYELYFNYARVKHPGSITLCLISAAPSLPSILPSLFSSSLRCFFLIHTFPPFSSLIHIFIHYIDTIKLRPLLWTNGPAPGLLFVPNPSNILKSDGGKNQWMSHRQFQGMGHYS